MKNCWKYFFVLALIVMLGVFGGCGGGGDDNGDPLVRYIENESVGDLPVLFMLSRPT